MRLAQEGDTVRVHYTGKLSDESVFDCSEGREPLEFVIGEGSMIPGFEQAVRGMGPGQCRTIHVDMDQAYGPRKEEMVTRVDRSLMPPDMDPQECDVLQVQTPSGIRYAIVMEAAQDEVTLDFNHPLAGQDLIFDIILVEIAQEATSADRIGT